MTYVEMLDLILTALYEKPGKRGHLVLLLQDRGVIPTLDEAYGLGQQLGEAEYVLYKPTLDDVSLALTSKGIDFIESSSFADPGTPLVARPANPYVLYNKLVNESGQITVTIDNANRPVARHILEQIRTIVNQDETIDDELRRGIIDCAEAVGYGIESGGPFNGYNLLTLLDLAFDYVPTAVLAQQLAVLFDE